MDGFLILGATAEAIRWIAGFWPVAVAILAAIAVRTMFLVNTLVKLKINQLRLDIVSRDVDDEVMH